MRGKGEDKRNGGEKGRRRKGNGEQAKEGREEMNQGPLRRDNNCWI